CTSQRRIALSYSPPAARALPSGVNATVRTPLAISATILSVGKPLPSRWTRSPVAVSTTDTVPPEFTQASSLPFGENTTGDTTPAVFFDDAPQALAGFGIVQAQCPIAAHHGDGPAVRCERGEPEREIAGAEAWQQLARWRFPKAHGFTVAFVGEPPAVGGKGSQRRLGHAPRQDARLGPGGGGPDARPPTRPPRQPLD